MNAWIKKHYKPIGIFIIIFIILSLTHKFIILLFYTFFGLFSRTENFTNPSENDFITLQHTINPNSIFDMQVLKNQVSQEELEYYNQNGIWYWSPEVKQLYQTAVLKNPYIRTYSGDSLINAQKIYNQNAILQILGQQTKEGKFLLTGIQLPTTEPLPNGYGNFAYSSGLKPRDMDMIKCNMQTDMAYPEKTRFLGKGGIFGEQLTTTEIIKNEDLPKVIPGFSFLKNTCNPCNAVNSVPKYDCPFLIKTNPTDNLVSPIWKYLWFG